MGSLSCRSGSTRVRVQSDDPVTPKRIAVTLILVTAIVILATGILLSGLHSSLMPPGDRSLPDGKVDPTTDASRPGDSVSVRCTEYTREVRSVIQGEPFTYNGTAPSPDIRTIWMEFSTDQDMGYSSFGQNVTINSDSSFSVTIGGNVTQQFWKDYRSFIDNPYYREHPEARVNISPYLHVCLPFPAKKECFDLLIVQDKNDPALLNPDWWIQVDPVPDQYTSMSQKGKYRGDFFINGTTNLPPGEQLSLMMTSTCMLPCPRLQSDDVGCCGSTYTTSAEVQPGPCRNNTWSVKVNTEPRRILMKGVNGRYDDTNGFYVMVTRQNRITGDNAWDDARFVVRMADEPPVRDTPVVQSRDREALDRIDPILLLSCGVAGVGILAFLLFRKKG